MPISISLDASQGNVIRSNEHHVQMSKAIFDCEYLRPVDRCCSRSRFPFAPGELNWNSSAFQQWDYRLTRFNIANSKCRFESIFWAALFSRAFPSSFFRSMNEASKGFFPHQFRWKKLEMKICECRRRKWKTWYRYQSPVSWLTATIMHYNVNKLRWKWKAWVKCLTRKFNFKMKQIFPHFHFHRNVRLTFLRISSFLTKCLLKSLFLFGETFSRAFHNSM